MSILAECHLFVFLEIKNQMEEGRQEDLIEDGATRKLATQAFILLLMQRRKSSICFNAIINKVFSWYDQHIYYSAVAEIWMIGLLLKAPSRWKPSY